MDTRPEREAAISPSRARHHSRETDRYFDDPASVIPGNAVRLQRNGAEAFPAWLAAIEAAQHRVSMEMYIFASDTIGRRFGEALQAAARRGVEVRLLYDFIGCRDTAPAFFAELRAAGVHTIVYHAHRFWRPNFWRLFRRNHRKTVVVDGEVAFTGGLNIADEWVSAEEGGGDWRDAAVEVRGPAVLPIEEGFLRTWNRRARKSFRLQLPPGSAPAAAGEVPAAVVANSERGDRFAIRRTALFAIRTSTKSIWLCNPYFVPDRGILRALTQAAARGVDVRVMLPWKSDSRVLDYAARASFSYLLKRGVRILQHLRVVHSKLLIVDEVFVSIGSYNMDRRSLAYNLEMVVNATSAELGAKARALFELESQDCREVDLEAVLNRGPLDRLLERLCHALRAWL